MCAVDRRLCGHFNITLGRSCLRLWHSWHTLVLTVGRLLAQGMTGLCIYAALGMTVGSMPLICTPLGGMPLWHLQQGMQLLAACMWPAESRTKHRIPNPPYIYHVVERICRAVLWQHSYDTHERDRKDIVGGRTPEHLWSEGLATREYPRGCCDCCSMRRTNSQLFTFPSGSGMYGCDSSCLHSPSTMNLYWWYLRELTTLSLASLLQHDRGGLYGHNMKKYTACLVKELTQEASAQWLSKHEANSRRKPWAQFLPI